MSKWSFTDTGISENTLSRDLLEDGCDFAEIRSDMSCWTVIRRDSTIKIPPELVCTYRYSINPDFFVIEGLWARRFVNYNHGAIKHEVETFKL